MAKSKFQLREDFFEKWTSKMAYILGFASADGCVSGNTFSINLHKKDVEVLEFIQKQLCPNKPIEQDKGRPSKTFRVFSTVLIKSLAKYNIIPRKSFQIRANFEIPEEFFGDYLRGIFDGDGWVYLRRNSLSAGICSASKWFLEDLRSKAGNIGRIRERLYLDRNPLYEWNMEVSDALKMRDLMYRNDCFSLKRKKEKFYSEFHKPSLKYWTTEQMNYLIEHWNEGLTEVGTVINKTSKAVSKKKWQLRTVKDVRIQKWEKLKI